MTASARYGLQLGSQQRNSMRADNWRLTLGRGTRISASRFTRPQLTKTGASNPCTSRLYELTSGASIAHIARVSQLSRDEVASNIREPIFTLLIHESVFPCCGLNKLLVGVHSRTIDTIKRLWHKRSIQPVLPGNRLEHILCRHQPIGDREGIPTFKIKLVLTGRYLVVARFNSDMHLLQCLYHLPSDGRSKIGREIEVTTQVVW